METLMNSDYLKFKNLKDTTVLLNKDFAQSKLSTDIPNLDLNYRLIKTDARLLRVLFEYNGFRQTDNALLWNLQWSSVSPPINSYDTLMEGQKINHFP